jgi:hypothetical protein
MKADELMSSSQLTRMKASSMPTNHQFDMNVDKQSGEYQYFSVGKIKRINPWTRSPVPGSSDTYLACPIIVGRLHIAVLFLPYSALVCEELAAQCSDAHPVPHEIRD